MIWSWFNRHPRVFDIGLAILSLGPMLGVSVRTGHPLALLLYLLATAPLVVRRRWPLEVFGTVVAVAAVIGLMRDPVPIPQLAIAVGTIAARLPRRTAFPAALAGLAVLVVPTLYSKGWSGSAAVSGAIFLAAAWLFGDSLRSRRAYISEIEDRAERLQREQVAQRERAAAEEKARIARELHDVVAHSVSVILVQADAADDVFDKAPERAHEAVRAIAETARTALEDLRRVLGALHQEPDFQPQPRLATIDQLAEKVRTTGLVVDVAVEGDPRPLPAAVDLSAYRIIQEALTNTVRHAEARRVAVKVRYDEELVLEVCDDGIGSANGKNVGGRGLIGMRERVALLGGQIAIGPRPTGGFSVSARIPIGLPQ